MIEKHCYNCAHTELKGNGRLICKILKAQVNGEACDKWEKLKPRK